MVTPSSSSKKSNLNLKGERAKAKPNKLWDRQPRRGERSRHVAEWQDHTFKILADKRRGLSANAPGRGVMQMDHALVSYMKDSAPRAPATPLGYHGGALYRGVTASAAEFAEIRRRGGWDDKSFQAFSRDVEVAQAGADLSIRKSWYGNPRNWKPFADHSVGIVWVLEVADVRRGTPWIWFADSGKMRVSPRAGRVPSPRETVNASWAPGKGLLVEQEEVLLPPGRLRAKGKPELLYSEPSSDTGNFAGSHPGYAVYAVRAKFEPCPRLDSLYVNPRTGRPDVSLDLRQRKREHSPRGGGSLGLSRLFSKATENATNDGGRHFRAIFNVKK